MNEAPPIEEVDTVTEPPSFRNPLSPYSGRCSSAGVEFHHRDSGVGGHVEIGHDPSLRLPSTCLLRSAFPKVAAESESNWN